MIHSGTQSASVRQEPYFNRSNHRDGDLGDIITHLDQLSRAVRETVDLPPDLAKTLADLEQHTKHLQLSRAALTAPLPGENSALGVGEALGQLMGSIGQLSEHYKDASKRRIMDTWLETRDVVTQRYTNAKDRGNQAASSFVHHGRAFQASTVQKTKNFGSWLSGVGSKIYSTGARYLSMAADGVKDDWSKSQDRYHARNAIAVDHLRAGRDHAVHMGMVIHHTATPHIMTVGGIAMDTATETGKAGFKMGVTLIKLGGSLLGRAASTAGDAYNKRLSESRSKVIGQDASRNMDEQDTGPMMGR